MAMSGRHATEQQRARVIALRAEGMPAPWIAEDVSLTPATVRKIAGAMPDAQAQWLSVWASIRRNASLLALHYEFTPSGEHHRD